MRSKLSFLILLGLSYCPVNGQQLSNINAPSKTLPNGLEIFVIKDNTVPMVTIELACKNHSFTESNDFNGLSHLYEHLFLKK